MCGWSSVRGSSELVGTCAGFPWGINLEEETAHAGDGPPVHDPGRPFGTLPLTALPVLPLRPTLKPSSLPTSGLTAVGAPCRSHQHARQEMPVAALSQGDATEFRFNTPRDRQAVIRGAQRSNSNADLGYNNET